MDPIRQSPIFPATRRIESFDDLHRREDSSRMDSVGRLLAGFTPLRITTADGSVLEVLAREIGGDGDDDPVGFQIRVRDSRVEMFGGRVTGLGSADVVPEGLTDGEWTSLGAVTNRVYYLDVQFSPTSTRYTLGNDQTLYGLDSGGEAATFRIGSAHEMPTDSTPPEIDTSNGDTIVEGRFSVQIGDVISGQPRNVRSGLLGLRFCAPNTLFAYELNS